MFKKIDIFYKGKYLCSTNAVKTCKAAKDMYIKNILKDSDYHKHIDMRNNLKDLKAFFDKERK